MWSWCAWLMHGSLERMQSDDASWATKESLPHRIFVVTVPEMAATEPFIPRIPDYFQRKVLEVVPIWRWATPVTSISALLEGPQSYRMPSGPEEEDYETWKPWMEQDCSHPFCKNSYLHPATLTLLIYCSVPMEHTDISWVRTNDRRFAFHQWQEETQKAFTKLR